MAKLPSATDIQRKPAAAVTPDISVKAIDYSPAAQAAGAMGNALRTVGGAFQQIAMAQEKTQEFDVQRRLLDFKLQSEMALEEHKRQMPAGGAGYAESWQDKFKEQAAAFVGEKDSAIPQHMRAKIGTALKQQEVMLSERAQRDAWAEQDRSVKEGLELTLGRTRDAVMADPNRLQALHGEGAALIDQAQMPPAMKDSLKKKYRVDLEEAAATSVADSVKDADSYARAKEMLAPHKADRVTAKGVASQIKGLGDVSAKYESGGRGVHLVSSGAGDPGGVSYGAHQLSTKDSMPAFLRSKEGEAYAAKFSGMRVGSSEFNATYKELARADPDGFAAAQHSFYSRTHFEPVREHAKGLGFAVEDRGVQEALFSMGIQHGGAKKIVSAAADAAGKSPAEQIKALYDARTDYVAGLGSLPDGTKQSVLNRYRREVRDAMALAGHPALGGEPAEVPAGQSVSDGYEGPYANLSLAKRRAIWARAEAQFDKEKKGIEAIIGEQSKVAGAGYMPPDPILNELERRVRATGDPLLAAKYDTMLAQAQWTGRLNKAPPVAIEEQARIMRDGAAAHGATKEQLAEIEHVEKLGASVRKAVNEDPMSWAHKSGITVPLAAEPPGDLEPRMRAQWQAPVGVVKLDRLDFRQPDIELQLQQRAHQAKGVGLYYGQPPQLFTKNERDFLKDTLRKGGDAGLHMLGTIASAATKAGLEPADVMREFTKDAPEVAVVGEMVSYGADPQALRTAMTAMQWRATQGEKFISTIDKAQAKPTLGEYGDVLAARPLHRDAVTHTANIIYEYEARRQNKETFSADLYDEVLHKVMGQTKGSNGVTYGGVGRQGTGWSDGKWGSGWGGQPKVLVPAGVRTDGFDDMVGALRAKDLEADPPVDGAGRPLSMGEIRQASWVSLEPGRYLLVHKTDHDGTKVLAKRPGGEDYILDVRPLLPAIQKRKPEIFAGYDGQSRGMPEPDAAPPAPPAKPTNWRIGPGGHIQPATP